MLAFFFFKKTKNDNSNNRLPAASVRGTLAVPLLSCSLGSSCTHPGPTLLPGSDLVRTRSCGLSFGLSPRSVVQELHGHGSEAEPVAKQCATNLLSLLAIASETA